MKLRELIIDWLTSSRYIRTLEARHHEQRQDFTLRLDEKDAIIKSLRAELAASKLECDRMRSVMLPMGSPAGQAYAARFTEHRPRPPLQPEFKGEPRRDWMDELESLMEDPDGIHSEGRQEVHQPGADDGAQPQS